MSIQFDKAFWEERWEELARDHAADVRGRRPNAQLVAEAADLAPGTALDAGCGPGADAIWLASRGWRVTAVDIATTAMRYAHEKADTLPADVANRIDWVQADLNTWAPKDHFDLVSSHYVHGVAQRGALFRRLAAAVAPGGTLLIVGHHPDDHHVNPSVPLEVFFTAEEVAASLEPDRWDIVVAETRTRPAHDLDGDEILRRDAVLRARKRV